ncbi:metallophosphoesterase [Rhodobacter sp. 24-YEA-8]|uniref:metallophosphoesterase n=1 Tax=Rhodobacter sp. 24-YEA-8 TaxID=1884310 RepID=UPI00089BD834|nr:metallophosphoesterase [Rhodobacter sp. 24-YEA-8]SED91052.1 serine/threonine protein phosphatase 1 [Rhodobacter sp. 24-YEA-8]
MTARRRLAPPVPDEPVCLVGDRRFLALRQVHFPQARVIFLGDMIDRGPDSATVLALVREEIARGALALAGNHEAMFIDFLNQAEPGRSWLKHSGFEMIASYGIDPTGGDPADLRDRLRAPMGTEAVVLQWGHRDFGRLLRPDGLWVAHGQNVVDKAFAQAGRIALDICAYATGRLCFALIDPAVPETEQMMIAVTP